MQKHGFACMHTLCAHSPLSEHLSFFTSISKTKRREEIRRCMNACVYMYLCVLCCAFSQKHTHNCACTWLGAGAGEDANRQSSVGHKTRSLQEVKDRELCLHLQAEICRIFITDAVRAEQSLNPRVNETF